MHVHFTKKNKKNTNKYCIRLIDTHFAKTRSHKTAFSKIKYRFGKEAFVVTLNTEEPKDVTKLNVSHSVHTIMQKYFTHPKVFKTQNYLQLSRTYFKLKPILLLTGQGLLKFCIFTKTLGLIHKVKFALRKLFVWIEYDSTRKV